MKKAQVQMRTKQNKLVVRATISFPADLYEMLETIAKRKKVSLAWVVRAAAETYVEEEQKDGNNDARRGR